MVVENHAANDVNSLCQTPCTIQWLDLCHPELTDLVSIS